MIFENIVRHSGLADPFRAHVQIAHEDDSIRCRIENDIAPERITPAILGRVESIKRALDNSQHMSSISSEGGTGFFKISKILTHDVRLSQMPRFGFVDTNRFFVELTFTVPKTFLEPSAHT